MGRSVVDVVDAAVGTGQRASSTTEVDVARGLSNHLHARGYRIGRVAEAALETEQLQDAGKLVRVRGRRDVQMPHTKDGAGLRRPNRGLEPSAGWGHLRIAE